MTDPTALSETLTESERPQELRVRAGAVVVLRLFDVANAIDLAAVEQLARAEVGGAARMRLSRAEPKAITFGIPPVGLFLESVSLAVGGRDVEAEVTARAYAFGAVSIALRVPVVDASWAALAQLSTQVDSAAAAAEAMWLRLLERLLDVIRPALDRPTTTWLQEDYRLTTVRAFDRPLDADQLKQMVDLAALLTDEQEPLSEGLRRDVLRHVYSYFRDDLVALSWDHAFIYDPRGESDVADVLEVANAQLLEMRYYDELLDAELPRMYERVAQAQGGLASLARRRYARLARAIY